MLHGVAVVVGVGVAAAVGVAGDGVAYRSGHCYSA